MPKKANKITEITENARVQALGGEVGGWNMHKHFMDNADYVQNIYAQWSFILTFYGLGNTIYNAVQLISTCSTCGHSFVYSLGCAPTV